MCDQQSLRSACAYTQSDQSLCYSLEYSISFKLLTKHHMEFLSLNEAAQARLRLQLLHCWKSHVTGHFFTFLKKNRCYTGEELLSVHGIPVSGIPLHQFRDICPSLIQQQLSQACALEEVTVESQSGPSDAESKCMGSCEPKVHHKVSLLLGPRREKTCLRGFRQSRTQTSLVSYRD